MERRPRLTAALAQARKAKCTLLVAKLDCLSRDVHFISSLMAHRVPIIVVALWPNAYPKEGSLMSDRIRLGLARKKAQGASLGNRTNLGEAQAKAVAVNRQAAIDFAASVLPIVREIQAMGILSAAAIAKALNDRAIRTARGRAWHDSTVRNLLARMNPH